jgi:hypothetical protein
VYVEVQGQARVYGHGNVHVDVQGAKPRDERGGTACWRSPRDFHLPGCYLRPPNFRFISATCFAL